MGRVCSQCGAAINQYHLGNLCFPCQEKQLETMIIGDEDLIDAEEYASRLGLNSAEQLKRLARKGVLAPNIPAIGQWRWYGKDFKDWLKQKQRAGDVFRKTAMGIASNMMTLLFT